MKPRMNGRAGIRTREAAHAAAAAKCLADDLDALIVHLRYPPRHRRRWRSTNLLERSLGEVNRRTKASDPLESGGCRIMRWLSVAGGTYAVSARRRAWSAGRPLGVLERRAST